MKLFLIFGSLIFIMSSCSSQELPRGVQELETNHQPAGSAGQIEVLEFLWLGCPVCRDFQSSWVSLKKEFGDEIIFRSMPAPAPNWAFDARVFFALDELGLLNDGLLANYFEDRQGPEAQSLGLGDAEGVARWLQENYGSSPEGFASMLESPLVAERFQEAEKLWQAYPLTGVPIVLITVPQSGKTYVVEFSQATDTKQRIADLLNMLKNK